MTSLRSQSSYGFPLSLRGPIAYRRERKFTALAILRLRPVEAQPTFGQSTWRHCRLKASLVARQPWLCPRIARRRKYSREVLHTARYCSVQRPLARILDVQFGFHDVPRPSPALRACTPSQHRQFVVTVAARTLLEPLRLIGRYPSDG